MTQRNRRAGLARPALAATAALVLAAAACGTDVPTAAAIEDMDVAAAEQHAMQAGLLSTIVEGRPLYIVDGKEVTEAEARAVAPDDISSIEVLKRAAAAPYGERGARGVIRMKTKAPLTTAERVAGVKLREGAPLRTAETTTANVDERVASKGSDVEEVKVAGYARALTAVEGEKSKRALTATDVEMSRALVADVKGERLLPSKKTAVTEADVAVVRQAEGISKQLPSKVRMTERDMATVQEEGARAKTVVRKAVPADVAQEPAGQVKLRRTAPDLQAPTASAPRQAAPATTASGLASPDVSLPRVPAPAGADAAAGEQRARTENPFVMIDGVPASPSVQLRTMAPDEILSVEVLKGEEAVRRYGARGANGAILITTKKGASR